SPFIPAAAWPGTEQRNSYCPALASLTVSLADWPVFRFGVALPTHVFLPLVAVAVVQILKLWTPKPAFLTSKGILPTGRFDSLDSLKPSSVGLPIVTLTTVTLLAVCVLTCAEAGSTPTQSSEAMMLRPQMPRGGLINRLRFIDKQILSRKAIRQ